MANIWEIKDLAGNVIGTIEKIPEGLGPIGWVILLPLYIILLGFLLLFWGIIGWVLLGISLFEEPSAIRVLLFLSAIITFALSILGMYTIATTAPETTSEGTPLIPIIGGLSLTYFEIAGCIVGLVLWTKEQ